MPREEIKTNNNSVESSNTLYALSQAWQAVKSGAKLAVFAGKVAILPPRVLWSRSVAPVKDVVSDAYSVVQPRIAPTCYAMASASKYALGGLASLGYTYIIEPISTPVSTLASEVKDSVKNKAKIAITYVAANADALYSRAANSIYTGTNGLATKNNIAASIAGPIGVGSFVYRYELQQGAKQLANSAQSKASWVLGEAKKKGLNKAEAVFSKMYELLPAKETVGSTVASACANSLYYIYVAPSKWAWRKFAPSKANVYAGVNTALISAYGYLPSKSTIYARTSEAFKAAYARLPAKEQVFARVKEQISDGARAALTSAYENLPSKSTISARASEAFKAAYARLPAKEQVFANASAAYGAFDSAVTKATAGRVTGNRCRAAAGLYAAYKAHKSYKYYTAPHKFKLDTKAPEGVAANKKQIVEIHLNNLANIALAEIGPRQNNLNALPDVAAINSTMNKKMQKFGREISEIDASSMSDRTKVLGIKNKEDQWKDYVSKEVANALNPKRQRPGMAYRLLSSSL